MRSALLFALFSAACLVPPQQGGGGSDTLLSQVEQDLSKYLTDHENGVAFVRCLGNKSDFYASPAEAARAIAAGCDAALAVALPRLGKVQDVDPVVVDGTTVGFVVRYSTQPDEPTMPPVEPEPMNPDPASSSVERRDPAPPPPPAEEEVTPKPEDSEPVTPKPKAETP